MECAQLETRAIAIYASKSSTLPQSHTQLQILSPFYHFIRYMLTDSQTTSSSSRRKLCIFGLRKDSLHSYSTFLQTHSALTGDLGWVIRV